MRKNTIVNKVVITGIIFIFLSASFFPISNAACCSVNKVESDLSTLVVSDSAMKLDPDGTVDTGLDCVDCFAEVACSDKRYSGLIIPDTWWENAIFDTSEPKRSLPLSHDWRSYTTPIKDQGPCGSCWAFATIAPLESALMIFAGYQPDDPVVHLSEQWLLSCNTNGWGCHGGFWAHDYLQFKPDSCGEVGIVLESDFPYEGAGIPCNPNVPRYLEPMIGSWYYIGDGSSIPPGTLPPNTPPPGTPSVASIKSAIYQYGPVSTSVYVDGAVAFGESNSFAMYDGGVYTYPEGQYLPPPRSNNHGVVLVGWDDNYYWQGSYYGVWILRNSWGTGWGDEGYMYIEYGEANVGYASCYIDYYGKPVINTRTGSTFDSIQQAIDDSATLDGDTIFVHSRPDPIQENIDVTKSLTLRGNDKRWTILEGDTAGDVIRISASDVTISGFTIKNSGLWNSAICVQPSVCNVIITDNIITDYDSGIWLEAESHTNRISGNIITNGSGRGRYGIRLLLSYNNTIIDNTIYSNGWGIQLQASYTNIITDNKIYNNLIGIELSGSQHNNIADNYIFENGYGVYCVSSNENTFSNNKLESNTVRGIYFSGASHNTIHSNLILTNSGYGLEIKHVSNHNIVYHNAFIGNTINAYDEGSNTWDDVYPSGGNYWDDYTGEDLNGDGIGDTPYDIPGGSNQDLHPLMYPKNAIQNIDTGKKFLRIQDAIDDSETQDGHTLFVLRGTYYENIVIDKQIQLLGEDRDTTIIDGQNSGNVIAITKAGVTVSGFTIRNSGEHFDCSGIRLSSSSRHNHIRHNHFIDNYRGIYVWESYAQQGEHTNNFISYNLFSNNFGFGIRLDGSTKNVIFGNVFDGGNISWVGIYLTRGADNEIFLNTFKNHRSPYIGGTSYGIMIENGSPLSPNKDNEIYWNNFIDNDVHAMDNQQSSYYVKNDWYKSVWMEVWNNPYYPDWEEVLFGGNYWDDYIGKYPHAQEDPEHPGFWDTDYQIAGAGGYYDKNPSMNEYDIYNLSYPPTPKSPSPASGANNVPRTVTLRWTVSHSPWIGNPEYQAVTCDVYFGQSPNSLVKVASNQSMWDIMEYEYIVSGLGFGTSYYWKIVAWTWFGESVEGPVWSFRTRNRPNPPRWIEPVEQYPGDPI